MGWFAILPLIVRPVSTEGSRRRLDQLTGPWIANETSPHD